MKYLSDIRGARQTDFAGNAVPALSWRWIAVLALAVLVSRFQIFGNPLVGWDEDFYLTAARFMTHGAIPFVDFWDRKPIGIFLIYYPAALFPGWAGVWAFQLMGCAAIVATGALIMRLAALAGWARGGGWAALFYGLWTILLKGQDGQTPIFYNMLVIAAAVLIVGSMQRRGDWFAQRLIAMVLCGLALQVKYSAIFEAVYFGLWLIGAEVAVGQRMGRLALRTLAYALAGLAPSLVVAAWYFAHGYGDLFIQANITANLERGMDPLAMLARNFAVTLAVMLIPLVLAFRKFRLGSGWLQKPAPQRFIQGWLLAAIAGLLFFPPWFDHYALPLLMVASLASARLFHDNAHKTRVLTGAMVAIALIAQVFIYLRMQDQGSTSQLAALGEATGHGSGSLFIYRAPHALYWLSGRPAPTRYLFNGTLSTSRETPSLAVRQEDEMRRIFAVEKPEEVVMRSPATDRRKNEVMSVKRILMDQLAHSYRQTATLRLGNQDLLVFRRVGK